uniref:Uncharacterized protein n=1 Tax=Anguilla anguilla TaxID=7936 RepID=A0A0E9RC71_ANGAN
MSLVPYVVYRLMTAFPNPQPHSLFKAAAVSFGLLSETLLMKKDDIEDLEKGMETISVSRMWPFLLEIPKLIFTVWELLKFSPALTPRLQ